MLLEGGLKWQPIALTPAELDFGRAREAAAREVALAFGVPPMLLGLPGDSTYANYAQANVALWRLTVLPLLNKVLHGFAGHLAHWWGGLKLEPDLDAIPALWSDREALWRHVAAADFLTVDEKRALLGWGPMAAGGGAGA
jgi:HK97 family phage portal protein